MALNDQFVDVPLFHESDSRNGIIVWSEITILVLFAIDNGIGVIGIELDAFVLHIFNTILKFLNHLLHGLLFFGSYCTIILYWCIIVMFYLNSYSFVMFLLYSLLE